MLERFSVKTVFCRVHSQAGIDLGDLLVQQGFADALTARAVGRSDRRAGQAAGLR